MVATLAGVAPRHPQTAYGGTQKSLQQKWAFVQCVTPDIGMAFQVVEYAMRDIFLPALFQGATAQIPGRAITGLSVRQAEIALPDPAQTAGENWTASCTITGHLAAALCGTADFRSGNHALLTRKVRTDIRQRHAEEAETALEEAWAAASKPDARQLGWIQRTGAWLSVLPSTVNGT